MFYGNNHSEDTNLHTSRQLRYCMFGGDKSVILYCHLFYTRATRICKARKSRKTTQHSCINLLHNVCINWYSNGYHTTAETKWREYLFAKFLFWFKFHRNPQPSSPKQWYSIGSDNGLVPNRRQGGLKVSYKKRVYSGGGCMFLHNTSETMWPENCCCPKCTSPFIPLTVSGYRSGKNSNKMLSQVKALPDPILTRQQ